MFVLMSEYFAVIYRPGEKLPDKQRTQNVCVGSTRTNGAEFSSELPRTQVKHTSYTLMLLYRHAPA